MEGRGEDKVKQKTDRMEERGEDRAKQDRKNGREGRGSSDKNFLKKVWTREQKIKRHKKT